MSYIRFVLSFLILLSFEGIGCTIFSAKDKKGNVWTGNNEDQVFNFNSYLTIVNKTDSTFGYICYTNSSSLKEFIQGGFNEAGLFYDGNSVPYTKYKDYEKKKDFPGSERSMMEYILRKCKSVPEVLALFKIYRLPGTETGQMHFADKYGNYGIVVADSMWMTKQDYQISTNYNLCHANKDNINCWRFPIAERILRNREPGLESFRDICDSTSQKKGSATIYSNIQNLNTGEIWMYYGSDFKRVYHTTLQELIAGGNRSLFIRELFSQNPLVDVYNTYETKGVQEAITKLKSWNLDSNDEYQLLRLFSSDIIGNRLDLNAFLFLELLLKIKEDDMFMRLSKAIVLYSTGRRDDALNYLKNYIKENPENPYAKMVLGQMNGKFDKNANASFELDGFPNAKSVFVEGLNTPQISYFMVQKKGKWIGRFKLSPDVYNYCFVVDGKRTLDPRNKEIVNESNLSYNKLIVADK